MYVYLVVVLCCVNLPFANILGIAIIMFFCTHNVHAEVHIRHGIHIYYIPIKVLTLSANPVTDR